MAEMSWVCVPCVAIKIYPLNIILVLHCTVLLDMFNAIMIMKHMWMNKSNKCKIIKPCQDSLHSWSPPPASSVFQVTCVIVCVREVF